MSLRTKVALKVEVPEVQKLGERVDDLTSLGFGEKHFPDEKKSPRTTQSHDHGPPHDDQDCVRAVRRSGWIHQSWFRTT